MSSEAKICQNCQTDFKIEPEDFAFYKRIQVPSPTFCPDCRLNRRMLFTANPFKLNKRKCNPENIYCFSMYSAGTPFQVFTHNYWHSDIWSPMNYGQNYDFSKPFFEQFSELLRKVPRINLSNINSINCDYCSVIKDSKNCYLTTGAQLEDCYYTNNAFNSKECFDCWLIIQCEKFYWCIDCEKCYKVFFAQYSNNCIDSAFLYNCSNCSNCFGCVNLKNKSYDIFNQPFSGEDYFKVLNDYELGSFVKFLEYSNRFQLLKIKTPLRFARIIHSVNVSGNNIRDSKNCLNCFDVFGVEDSKYIIDAGLGFTDNYDVYNAGFQSSLIYETNSCGRNSSRMFFSSGITESNEIYYSDNCRLSSSYLFGCVGLKNKQYAGVQSDNKIYKNTIEHHHHKKEHCPNKFETSYAPDRSEIVYCEQCYLQEVA